MSEQVPPPNNLDFTADNSDFLSQITEEIKEDRDTLFRLLTEEIKDLHEADKLQGWTPWILSATFISMAWLIVQDFMSGARQIVPIHGTFLVVSFTLEAVRSIRRIFQDNDRKGPFADIRSEITALTVFVGMLWALTIAISSFRFVGAGKILVIIGIVNAFFVTVGALFVLVFLSRISPPPMLSARRYGGYLSGFMLTIYLLGIKSIWDTKLLPGAQIGEIRVGALLALSAYVLVLLSQGTSRSNEKRSLIDLRRDLMLGVLTPAEVRHRTRRALQGLGLFDVYREDVRKLFRFISDVRSIYDDAFRRIENLKASVQLTPNTGSQLQPIEKMAIGSTLDILESYEQRVNEISHEYQRLLKSVRARAKFTARIDKSIAIEEAQLMAEINMAEQPANEELERFGREFKEIQDTWNSFYPQERRNFEPFRW